MHNMYNAVTKMSNPIYNFGIVLIDICWGREREIVEPFENQNTSIQCDRNDSVSFSKS